MSPSAVHRFVLALLLAISLVLGSLAGAQPAPLPPDAQMAFERGLAAVQQQDWNLAVRYFTQAQKSIGRYDSQKFPSLLFNLGLAHAKAGHDLAAMAWLMAYLAAAPEAPNAAQVRTLIVQLDVAVESKVRKILNEAATVARQIPAFGPSIPLGRVARAQARVGDINGALATHAASGFPRREEASLWITYAARIAKDGRTAEAEQVFSRWAGRVVNETGNVGPWEKQLLDEARRTIDLEKTVSRESCFACVADNISDRREVVGLEGFLKEAAQFEPRRAFEFLDDLVASLDWSLVYVRQAWRAHPAYRAR